MGQKSSIGTVVLILAIAAVIAAIATGREKTPITNNPKVSYRGDLTLILDGRPFEGSVQHIPGTSRIDFHIGGVPVAALADEKENFVRVLRLNARRMVYLSRQLKHREINFLRDIVKMWDSSADLIGTENIGGHTVKKYLVDGRRGRYEIWFTEHGIVMRLRGEGDIDGKRGKIDYRLYNLQIGQLERKAFTVPKGYIKVSNFKKLTR